MITLDEVKAVIEKSPSRTHWKQVHLEQHDGIDVPLFSLYSQNSCGIGEYPDLLKLIEFCKKVGMQVIQLLPLNDTGRGSSPYSSLSAFALNPIHLGLASLQTDDSKLTDLLSEGKKLTKLKRVNYQKVYELKKRFLKRYYKLYGEELSSQADYQEFLNDYSWLKPYALYKVLKNKYKVSWHKWPKSLQNLSPIEMTDLVQQHKDEVNYHCLVQYLCFQQMAEVKKKAEEEGVFIKGDIPILVNDDSAEAWSQGYLFDEALIAGAPPDQYAPKGQKWGFPIYNWKAVEADDFNFWKERLKFASQFYHLYRIDHFVGFFRIWAISKGKSAKDGNFFPEDESLWIPQGRKILHMMLSCCTMLPIAEDLGVVPNEVRECMTELGICGTKVFRWERWWEGDQSFIRWDQYHPLSMTTVSTHDSETLQQWWEKRGDEARVLAAQMGWAYEPILTKETRKQLLRLSHSTSSLFHINLLQEYLPLVDEYTPEKTGEDRVNIPGTVSDKNWSCRFKPSVEEMLANENLQHEIRDVLN